MGFLGGALGCQGQVINWQKKVSVGVIQTDASGELTFLSHGLLCNRLLNNWLLNNRHLSDYRLCLNRVSFVVKAILKDLFASLYGPFNRLA